MRRAIVSVNDHVCRTTFLQSYASARSVIAVATCLSVCLSVCHVDALCRNGLTYRQTFFTAW